MEEVKFRLFKKGIYLNYGSKYSLALVIFLTKNALSFNAVIILNKNFKNVLVKKRDCE